MKKLLILLCVALLGGCVNIPFKSDNAMMLLADMYQGSALLNKNCGDTLTAQDYLQVMQFEARKLDIYYKLRGLDAGHNPAIELDMLVSHTYSFYQSHKTVSKQFCEDRVKQIQKVIGVNADEERGRK